MLLEFKKKPCSKNNTQMASFAYHKVFICSTVAKGWAEERPSNKPRQPQRKINAIKWKGNVTACIRNLKTSDNQVALLSSECGCFIIKLDVEFHSFSSIFLHLSQRLKASKCCFSFFRVLIKSSRWFLKSLRRVWVFFRPLALWDCIFHEPTTLPTSFKEALSSKNACFVYVLEDLCLRAHPHNFVLYQSLLKIVVANGSWIWGMQWWQCSQRKNYCLQWWKTSEKLIQSLRCQKWPPSFDWPS